ncbi:MAG TPA: GIY-YIG nuclease family protein [Candidatus Kapabacteria bacterium]|nr:GIY-YIG nuclease family protein [Candidatus Kapabacteria bacterium]
MSGYVYITSSRSKVLYIGVTNNLARRIYEHKHKLIKGFTSRYDVDRLVYYELFEDIRQAIDRETTLKGWIRKRKIELIETMNPEWNDLSDQFGISERDSSLRSE